MNEVVVKQQRVCKVQQNQAHKNKRTFLSECSGVEHNFFKYL